MTTCCAMRRIPPRCFWFRTGITITAAKKQRIQCPVCVPASTGRRWRAWTTPGATVIWCAAARPWKPTWNRLTPETFAYNRKGGLRAAFYFTCSFLSDASPCDEVVVQAVLFRLRQPLGFLPLVGIQFRKEGIAADIGMNFRCDDFVNGTQGLAEQLFSPDDADARRISTGLDGLFERPAHRCSFRVICGAAPDDHMEHTGQGAT